ncbi:mechanosensitive ion channel [Laspinema sp. D1]|uniref:Mechanosensitive ion channel n=1 Tax=Laspinema palackyanum D2a TaxID=2953684 RepID=A0ABT2MQ63_9CYAN|nr:mechanosensitive ion channel [Laspinema sp. D2b]MCT7966878.1 mechanosensitive ion channel [Laspinema sp. D2a]
MNEALKRIVAQSLSWFTTPIPLGNYSVSISAMLQLIIWVCIVLFLSRALKKFLKYRLLVKLGIDEGNREAMATIISYSSSMLGLIIVLQSTGFNLGSLLVIAGGLGVGIGFGLQEVTRNFISGLTLLIERKLKVGDFIEFDGMSGYVKEVSLRSTLIRTRDGGDVVVPNSKLVENKVLNWSYDSFHARIQIPVGVAYNSDTVLVTETLLNAAYMEPAVLHDPPPKVLFKNFGDNALNFELWVWVNRIDREPFIRSSLNFIIEYNLRQNHITVPFPQRDLWIRNGEDLSRLGRKNFQQNGHRPEMITEPVAVATSNKPLSLKDLLRQVTYFQNFTDLELRQLIEIGHRKRLYPSQVLFQEGDPGDAFYIVLSGSVEVFVEKINKHLTNLGAGKFFGELSLMLGIPRTASVRALEETILFTIHHNAFQSILREHPELAEEIVQELCKHQEELAQRQQQLRTMGLLDATEDDKNPVVWVRKRLQNLFHL